MERFVLSEAGNVRNPALLVLLKKGYKLKLEQSDDEPPKDSWSATNDGKQFNASSLLVLLGLVGVFESRGEDWQTTEEERIRLKDFYEKL